MEAYVTEDRTPTAGRWRLEIVGNAVEFTAAVTAAAAEKMGLAVSLIVSATLQISLFVTPFLVISS